MVPIELEESAGLEQATAAGADPLRRAVHVALAIYLLPVVAIVFAIGGASIAIGRAAGLASRMASRGSRGIKPGHLPSPRSRPQVSRVAVGADRRRARVGP